MSEEQLFRNILPNLFDEDGCFAEACVNSIQDEVLANSKHLESRGSSDLNSSLKGANEEDFSNKIAKNERNLWMLLNKMSLADLLLSSSATSTVPVTCTPTSLEVMKISMNDVIINAYKERSEIKKGGVFQDWNESMAVMEDLFFQLMPRLLNSDAHENNEIAWNFTHSKLRDNRHNRLANNKLVTEMHPDSQVRNSDGMFLSLHGSDSTDQLVLWRCLHALVRSGQMHLAHELSLKHHLYSLSACLGGCNDLLDSVETQENVMEIQEQSEYVVKRGNARKAHWLLTCYKYVNKLASCNSNWEYAHSKKFNDNETVGNIGTYSVAIYEMFIYASLSNNINVLMQLPMISSWNDKYWVLTKAIHERNLLQTIYETKLKKREISQYFIGCDDVTLGREKEYLDLINNDLGRFSSLLSGPDMVIFHPTLVECLPYSKAINQIVNVTNNNAEEMEEEEDILNCSNEDFFLYVQVCIAQGMEGFHILFEELIKPFFMNSRLTYKPSSNSNVQIVYATTNPIESESYCCMLKKYSSVIRMLTHIILWSKYSPQAGEHIVELVTDELFRCATMTYINVLIYKQQTQCVALYAAMLPRPLSVLKYTHLILSIPLTGPVYDTLWMDQVTNMLISFREGNNKCPASDRVKLAMNYLCLSETQRVGFSLIYDILVEGLKCFPAILERERIKSDGNFDLRMEIESMSSLTNANAGFNDDSAIGMIIEIFNKIMLEMQRICVENDPKSRSRSDVGFHSHLSPGSGLSPLFTRHDGSTPMANGGGYNHSEESENYSNQLHQKLVGQTPQRRRIIPRQRGSSQPAPSGVTGPSSIQKNKEATEIWNMHLPYGVPIINPHSNPHHSAANTYNAFVMTTEWKQGLWKDYCCMQYLLLFHFFNATKYASLQAIAQFSTIFMSCRDMKSVQMQLLYSEFVNPNLSWMNLMVPVSSTISNACESIINKRINEVNNFHPGHSASRSMDSSHATKTEEKLSCLKYEYGSTLGMYNCWNSMITSQHSTNQWYDIISSIKHHISISFGNTKQSLCNALNVPLEALVKYTLISVNCLKRNLFMDPMVSATAGSATNLLLEQLMHEYICVGESETSTSSVLDIQTIFKCKEGGYVHSLTDLLKSYGNLYTTSETPSRTDFLGFMNYLNGVEGVWFPVPPSQERSNEEWNEEWNEEKQYQNQEMFIELVMFSKESQNDNSPNSKVSATGRATSDMDRELCGHLTGRLQDLISFCRNTQGHPNGDAKNKYSFKSSRIDVESSPSRNVESHLQTPMRTSAHIHPNPAVERGSDMGMVFKGGLVSSQDALLIDLSSCYDMLKQLEKQLATTIPGSLEHLTQSMLLSKAQQYIYAIEYGYNAIRKMVISTMQMLFHICFETAQLFHVCLGNVEQAKVFYGIIRELPHALNWGTNVSGQIEKNSDALHIHHLLDPEVIKHFDEMITLATEKINSME